MSYMLKVLPSTLKSELAQVLYKDALLVNNFLRNRDDNFYAKYLEELKTERFSKGDIIAKSGNKVENVFFIMSGVVQNLNSKRYFESGQMINHECFIKKTGIT